VIRGLVANPFSVAIEKVFKGLVLAIDGMEREAEKWRGEVSKAVEREKGLSGKVQEIQREMTTVQQAACRSEGKLQHQIDALMRQIGKYEEQIALYRMELSNL
jgi:chromosome segregation ATPase